MTRRRAAKLDRDAAERLLAGEAAVDASTEALAALLAAAAAPARGGAVPGEHAALAAFRAAQLSAAPSRRPSMLSRLLTVKVAVGAAVLVTAGGVALAASSHGRDDQPVVQAVEPASSAHETDKSPAHSAASPSPSLPGLCRAYDKVRGNPGKPLRNPAFRALIEAAGGEDEVADYCEKVLADEAKPGREATPGNRGSGGPKQERPTGPPPARPGR